jgi:hypothetical protein
MIISIVRLQEAWESCILLAMLDREDLQDACMIEYQSDNLVLVNQEKYILNWDPDQVVNISLGSSKSRRQVSQEQIKQKIR